LLSERDVTDQHSEQIMSFIYFLFRW